MASAISECASQNSVTEIRLRVGRPLVVLTVGEKKTVKSFGVPYIVSASDIEKILGVASAFSIYSVNDQIVKGYIPAKKVRIGVAGEGVSEKNLLVTVKHINYMVIRIPHEIKGVADKIKERIFANGVLNTLVISPPGAGKTTLLRELARLASFKYNTLLIDERYEFAYADNGLPTLDVGDCDVVSGVGKAVAYENCIRAMNPELIVTDELFSESDVNAVADIIRSGVKVFASLHGEDENSVTSSKVFCRLNGLFDIYVVLSKTPAIGTVKKIIDCKLNGVAADVSKNADENKGESEGKFCD